MYDAIVIGARCAGSPTAMLLARRGYKVLLLDRDGFPSDVMSTHFIQQAGTARLHRWGLLDQVRNTNGLGSGVPEAIASTLSAREVEVLLLLLGGLMGLALVSALIPAITAASGHLVNLPRVPLTSWLLGIVFMLAIGFIVGAAPAWRAMRLRIVDALAER